jgi:hypothetical protein
MSEESKRNPQPTGKKVDLSTPVKKDVTGTRNIKLGESARKDRGMASDGGDLRKPKPTSSGSDD